MIPRHLTERILERLAIAPAVFLNGARQVGKTTLAKQLIDAGMPRAYYTLDTLETLQAAQADPQGFVDNLPLGAVVDEVQRAPELLLPLKRRIDAERQAGMFLLTGSANPLTLPRVADALVGRMATLTLHPFSQGELEGTQPHWLTRAFTGAFPMATYEPLSDIWARVAQGGYPEAVALADPRRRQLRLRDYADTLLTRDVQILADIERTADMARLLRLLAAQTCQILNLANLSRESGIPHSTLQRYFALLETLMVVVRVPPWYANISQRLLKSPKVMLNDTGLALALLNYTETRLAEDDLLRGRMLENFVGMELLKQIACAPETYQLYHLRTAKGQEVDFVLEDPAGRLFGVEVKASATVQTNDFRHLRAFRAWAGERWAGGVVFYLGATQVPFGEGLWASPLQTLWRDS
jgi:predicted AAA+ superfamily ATPase